MSNGPRRAGLACAALACALGLNVRDAAACGGCFHPTAEQGSSVITDHRMVFKVSTTETILWDQVRYSGDPSEFAWVLPVHAGAKVELSRDAWIATLDTITTTTILPPDVSCPRAPSRSRSGSTTSGSSTSSGSVPSGSSSGGGGGCGGGSSSSSAPSYADGRGTYDASASPGEPSRGAGEDGGFSGNQDVQVVAQSVIGPYQAVTIRSSDGKGITPWLTDNGFAIPDAVKPIIDAYTKASFDFIALRLRPNVGVRAMRPVRVVTPGADVTLPLRMVAAGVGSHVGLTLWVLGEGRYHMQNFPDAPLDGSELKWNPSENRSNLKELTASALAANGGRGWLTEAAFQPATSLSDAYASTCQLLPERTVPCDEKALPSADGAPDGGAASDGGGGPDADAGDPDGGPLTACTKTVSGCDGYDDFDVATRGLHAGDVWVTRLRADLPVGALDADLELEATTDQRSLSPQHATRSFTDASFDPCAGLRNQAPSDDPSPHRPPPQSSGSHGDDSGGCSCKSARVRDDVGTFFVVGLTGMALALGARRRRR